MPEPYLEITSPLGAKKVLLGSNPLTIGRHASNVLAISDNEASRFHCVIEKAPEGFRVRDLDSRNGTKLNGALIKVALMLPGDVVTVGQTAMKLVAPVGSFAPAAVAKVQKTVENMDLSMDDDADTGVDPEGSLRRLADTLADQTFGETDLSILNARGQVLHGAAPVDGRKKSKAPA